MGHVASYRDLDVWQVGMDLVLDCYAVSGRFPAHERFGLTSQTRRAAVSIPSNVAEGHNRRSPHSNNVYRNHVSIALGSSAELETHLEIAVRLGYATSRDLAIVNQRTDRVGRMLRRLQQTLERPPRSNTAD
jgi:four helix bundle protein